jgi:DNA mismatch repair protein MutS2
VGIGWEIFTFAKQGGERSSKNVCVTLSLVLKSSTDMTPENELHLRHLTLDEALPRLDKYLNDAFMAGLYQVRIVHGKGTGVLRQEVRRILDKHPLVESYRPAVYGEGSGGVTIVELARK